MAAAEGGFFDDYRRFKRSSTTSNRLSRLNLRHRAIFEELPLDVAGQRVLDIGSHDGRWTLAALKAGASHGTGIEARAHLVSNAQSTLQRYGIESDAYSFIEGSVFDVMAQTPVPVDTVLCLGFFYHTLRYNELWHRMRSTGASTVVIDTMVDPSWGGDDPYIRLVRERVEREGNAVADDFSYGDKMLIGRPNLQALRLMGLSYGYELVQKVDWATLLDRHPGATGVRDYRQGRRETVPFSSAE